MSDQPSSNSASVLAPDWEEFLRRHQGTCPVEVDLRTLRPGDTLAVLTQHTTYTLRMLKDLEAMLTTNRPDRPSGRVRLNGCTFGASSTIKPDHLFCGGNLEFAHGDGPQISTTTKVKAMYLVQAATTTPTA